MDFGAGFGAGFGFGFGAGAGSGVGTVGVDTVVGGGVSARANVGTRSPKASPVAALSTSAPIASRRATRDKPFPPPP